MTYTAGQSSNSYYTCKKSCADAFETFLANNWQHLLFLVGLLFLVILVFVFSIPPYNVSSHIRYTIFTAATSLSLWERVGLVLSFVLPVVPIGIAVASIGDIYGRLYQYLQLLYHNIDFEDDDESTTAWAVSKFLSSLAAKQVSLAGFIGVSSASILYYIVVASF